MAAYEIMQLLVRQLSMCVEQTSLAGENRVKNEEHNDYSVTCLLTYLLYKYSLCYTSPINLLEFIKFAS